MSISRFDSPNQTTDVPGESQHDEWLRRELLVALLVVSDGQIGYGSQLIPIAITKGYLLCHNASDVTALVTDHHETHPIYSDVS